LGLRKVVPGTPPLTVAGLGVTPRPWDKQANFAKLEHFATLAAADGAQLVVTPEGFLEGYLWQDDDPQVFTPEQYLELGETIDGDFATRAAGLAGDLGIYLGLGFAERRGDLMYNSMAVFGPSGELVSRHQKCHTADDEPFNTKGTELQVFETPFGPWGVLICMDRQPPEAMRVLALRGAQLVIVPAWGMCGEMNDAMMRTRAYENGVYVLFVHPRRCLVIDPGGKIVAGDQGESDTVVLARITLADFSELSPIQYRRPELYGEITRTP
jgi:predicted amidohydrolase